MSHKIKILIVEDEQIAARDIKQNLSNLGYTVVGIAATGKKALQCTEETQPDLVLMDIVLKGKMDGIETAEQIRKLHDIPIVYLTAHADERTLNKAKITVPFGYILKPVDERELQSTIEMAVYRHEMEKRLKERESWFSTTLRSIGDGVVATDEKDCITFMNSMAEELTGWSQKDALGKSVNEVFHLISKNSKEAIDSEIKNTMHVMESRDLKNYTILLSGNSREIPIEHTVSPIKDDRGLTIGSVVVFRDITERLSAENTSRFTEEALRESEERYRSLFEESRDAIYITTRKGNFVIANQSAMDLFGFKKEEMIRLNISELYADAEEWKQFKRDIEQKGSVRDYEVKFRNKNDEELNCLLTSSLRRTKNGKILGYQGIIRNITERKRAEEEKEKIQAQLLQAQKMEAVGILAGGIAHDFNNILTVIQGNSELCLLKVDESNSIYRELKEIQVAAMRAADLTSQLLLFSRKKPMNYGTVNLNQIVESLLKMLHRLIGEDIGVSTDLESELWMVRADRGTMEQVIMNIAVNARDAMPDGGRLRIKSENVTLDDRMASNIPEARAGKFVRLTVSDTGVGMEDETIQRIFEPFFSTKATGRGTGLGLSVVYGIVKQHAGWIHVSSVRNEGSTFAIYIPAATPKIDKKIKESVCMDEFQGDGSRVLVVEDEKGVKDFTTEALKENGYRVLSAGSAGEAISVFEREDGHVDLVLSDVVLSDKNGIELVDELLLRKPQLKVILCSGYTGKKSQWFVIQQRGFRFLQKPYSMIDLIRAVKETFTSN